jgi:hypothetical protein
MCAFHNSVDDRESESCTLTCRLSCEKGVEYARTHTAIHTASGIAYNNSRTTIGNVECDFNDARPIANRMRRIGDQVNDDLM